MNNNHLIEAAGAIGDFLDALRAEDLNSETTSRIVVECSPVIVSHVLMNEG